MSYSISTLLTRNLHDVFGEIDPKRRAGPLTRSSQKMRVLRSKAVYRGVTRLIGLRARSSYSPRLFDIS